MKNDRLFQIIYILLEKKSITAPELARLLEVSTRTVYRDIDALSMSGVPVCTAAGKGGGISLMSGYTFDKALLTDDEQNQILFAVQSLHAANQPVGALLHKLGSAFQKENTNWIEVDFSRWGFHHADNTKFELLKTAILSRRVLKILYCGASGEISHRELKPLKLVFKEKSWYLQAFCMKAEDFRLFKIGRMLEVTLSETQFEDDFEPPPLESKEPPRYPTTTIKLRLVPALAFRVYDEFDPERIECHEDGSFTVTVDFPMDDWVYGYLLSFGTGMDILEPPALKERLAQYAKKIYDHHIT